MNTDLDNLDHMELWNKWIESPEGKAREKLHAALTELRSDPEITASALCAEYLDLVLRLDPSDVGAETVFDLVAPLTAYFLKLQGQSGVAAMLAKSPKQADKARVLECWKAWQKSPLDRGGKPKYKNNEAFAKDMLKFESLESTQVIARWCRLWVKEHVTQPAQ